MSVSRAHALLVLVGFLVACYLVAGISSTFSVAAIPQWYAGLQKPSFNPPNWVFGPVWTVLYTLMAIAAWLVWREPDSALRSSGLGIWWVQLLLNFVWSWMFFREHRLDAALLEIVVLWLGIVAATLLFARVRPAAAWMMAPYAAWVAFAGVLNFAIWRLNPR